MALGIFAWAVGFVLLVALNTWAAVWLRISEPWAGVLYVAWCFVCGFLYGEVLIDLLTG